MALLNRLLTAFLNVSPPGSNDVGHMYQPEVSLIPCGIFYVVLFVFALVVLVLLVDLVIATFKELRDGPDAD